MSQDRSAMFYMYTYCTMYILTNKDKLNALVITSDIG